MLRMVFPRGGPRFPAWKAGFKPAPAAHQFVGGAHLGRPYKQSRPASWQKTFLDPTNKTPDFQKEKDGATAAPNWTNELTMTIY